MIVSNRKARTEPRSLRSRSAASQPVVPTIEEQLALRARLQSVETELLAKGQRHVQLIGAGGTFEWVKAGALHEPIQQAQGDIQEAEDMIVAQGLRNVMVATDEGLFLWHAKPTKPKASKRPKGDPKGQ